MSADRFTEILNYLSAMSRDIGEFRSETKVRFDALEMRMGKLETRMDSLETRMDSLEARMDSLEIRMNSLETRMDSLETRMGGLEAEVRSVREDMRLMWHRTEITTQDLMEVRTRQRSHSARLEAIEAK